MNPGSSQQRPCQAGRRRAGNFFAGPPKNPFTCRDLSAQPGQLETCRDFVFVAGGSVKGLSYKESLIGPPQPPAAQLSGDVPGFFFGLGEK